ncbi:MAG TPA: phosphoglucomutase/phosphomannomutase family protein [Actinobacteria bacterium]|nr:phosphoglucomutase/phosphomannomutase family protein [Actinomycetota bacterium]
MIKFGTDGWRDIIADGFTFANVRDVTQAICDYLNGKKDKISSARPKLIVGYDTRFLSKEFALEAALVAVANDIEVYLTNNFAPTPAVSFAVVDIKADGAILITASHNPFRYNGLKFKASYGGSATPRIIGEIENQYLVNQKKGKKPLSLPVSDAEESSLLKNFNPKKRYIEHILEIIDKDIFRGCGLRIGVDPLYGAGQGYLKDILLSLGCWVKEVHNVVNPSFGGLNPEPIKENLKELAELVISERCDIGLALDGDADRIGIIDAEGNFVDSHRIFAILLNYLAGGKGWNGEVVKTVSTTRMVGILADKFNLPLFETSVGFKYICDRMLSNDVLIGGEESGGLGVKNHIPERDGILMGLLVVEAMLASGKSLKELIKSLMDEIGYFYYDRLDLVVDGKVKIKAIKNLDTLEPKTICGLKVDKINKRDGYKFYLADGSWLMVRPSGTETVIRIYAEAPSINEVKDLLNEGRMFVEESG